MPPASAGPSSRSRQRSACAAGISHSIPARSSLRAESGGGQYGMTFDDWGRKFVCSNSDHLQIVMYEDRYVARNPFLAAPSPHVSIAADGPAAAVFRISPVEPWRILRTKMRVAGEAHGPIEGGGTPAGYFTSATGITIYRGDAWPAEYRGQAFVGEVAGNLVHRKVISDEGIGFVARRVDAGKEFLASTDIWFRPVVDGQRPGRHALRRRYVSRGDRASREPARLDPQAARPDERPRAGPHLPDRARRFSTAPAATTRRSDDRTACGDAWNIATVGTATRRPGCSSSGSDKSAIGPLEKLATGSTMPEARVQGMCALAALGSLTPDVVLHGLNDSHPRVREHAVRLSESIAAAAGPVRPEIANPWRLSPLSQSPLMKERRGEEVGEQEVTIPVRFRIIAKLLTMVDDADARVRYQVAFSLGAIPQTADRNAALTELLVRDGGNSWVRMAVFSSLAEGADDLFKSLVADPLFRSQAHGQRTLEQLAQQIGAAGRKSDDPAIIHTIEMLPRKERAVRRGFVARIRPRNDAHWEFIQRSACPRFTIRATVAWCARCGPNHGGRGFRIAGRAGPLPCGRSRSIARRRRASCSPRC